MTGFLKVCALPHSANEAEGRYAGHLFPRRPRYVSWTRCVPPLVPFDEQAHRSPVLRSTHTP